MKILITGSGGYVASWLAPELEQHGHEVSGVDMVMPDKPTLNMTQADVSDHWQLKAILNQVGPELVVHLAAHYGRVWGETDPAVTIHKNVVATAVVAQECERRGIRLFYTSSSEVYGVPRGSWSDRSRHESDFGLVPLNMYGWTKLWGEQACEYFMPARQLQIARLNMIFGPGPQKVGFGYNALHNMVQLALRDEPIDVHRDTSRSWLWAGDAARACRAAIESDWRDTVNITQSPAEALSAYELARMVIGLLGSRSTVVYTDQPPGLTPRKYLSDDTVRRLGWKPKMSLEDGILRVAKWLGGASVEDARGSL